VNSTAGSPVGLCVVDKPAGWTSHDVVARCRRLLGTRKVGHSGTLDPMATGLLVLGVGPATRLLQFLSGLDKDYDAEFVLGVETDSLDADGEVVATHDTIVDPAAVERAAAGLRGEIDQIPPMVSAIKVDGVPLYRRARAGEEVERTARRVHVGRFEVEPTEDPHRWRASVTCSSGTYVRVLAADIGHAVGSGAHLSSLRRTRVGPFTIDEATPLDAVDPAILLPPSALSRVLSAVSVDPDTAIAVGHGKVLERSEIVPEGFADHPGPWAVLDPDGDLIAVYQPHTSGRVKPVVVLSRQ
jgi:tRNA pseudouridine55 synthase